MPVTSLQLACLLLAQLAPGDSPTLQPAAVRSVLTQPSAQPSLPLNTSPPAGEPTPAPPRELQTEPPDAPSARPISPAGLVVPASADEPLLSRVSVEVDASPKALLLRAFSLPAASELTGRPLPLREALGQSLDRNRQLTVVKVYWRVAIASADYHWSVDELEYLLAVADSASTYEQATLIAARAAAEARRREARLAASAAQYDLAAAAQSTTVDTLPLPSDLPLVGPYRTNFDNLFGNRAAPMTLRRINRTLPQLLELIEARTAAVVGAENALAAASRAYHQGEIRLEPVLRSHQRLRDQRIAFLTAVRDYNATIADYAMSVAGPSVGRDDVVSMLITTTPRTKSVLVPRRTVVTPAAAEETVDDRATPAEAPARSIPLGDDPPAKLVPVEPLSPLAEPSEAPSTAPAESP